MSANNGVIRIGRKGIAKFAFGEGEPFEIDVVVAFNQWATLDDGFREDDPERPGRRTIPLSRMPEFYSAAQSLVYDLSNTSVTVAEALDFAARLREEYDKLSDFFVPKSPDEPESPGSSEAELIFSEEQPPTPTSS